jgi:hypothetical protein
MINTKLQSIIDTKSAIGNAIVNKGGTITGETPFFNYAAQIDGISTGTPQTIFTASDGSKWALTNAVNLVNDAGNVTHDFNYWQPANNSTSDPILNIGTVGANISGNIQLVPVNQVNIAQYVNIVATDTDGAKYEGFNGFDQITNPTPTGNTTFNRWLLNNSATGTVVFANATFTTGTYNGPNATVDITNMSLINTTTNYGTFVRALAINDSFLYIGGFSSVGRVHKLNESNLTFVSCSASFGVTIESLTTNNGFVYVGGGASNNPLIKLHESNLVNSANTATYNGRIEALKTNNSFIFSTHNNFVRKHYESNLVLSANSSSFTGLFIALDINDSFVFASGANQVIRKFHESNLVESANSAAYGGTVNTLKVNNAFVYIAGVTNQTVQKFHESNLVFVGNTASYGGTIRAIDIRDGFIYVGGATNETVKKYYESNLSFVGNTTNAAGSMFEVQVNNGFIYTAGGNGTTGDAIVGKFNTQSENPEVLTFYTATKIKE